MVLFIGWDYALGIIKNPKMRDWLDYTNIFLSNVVKCMGSADLIADLMLTKQQTNNLMVHSKAMFVLEIRTSDWNTNSVGPLIRCLLTLFEVGYVIQQICNPPN